MANTEGVLLLQLGDFLLHGVGGLVERDDHQVAAARTPLDRHLGAQQHVVGRRNVCFVFSMRFNEDLFYKFKVLRALKY